MWEQIATFTFSMLWDTSSAYKGHTKSLEKSRKGNAIFWPPKNLKLKPKMPHKAFCMFIFSNSLLFQPSIFLLLKAPCKGFVLMENIDHKTNRFGNNSRQIYLKCSFSHSKLTISVISKPKQTWHFRIKMFKILIFYNHSISSMITNELNLFI